MRCDVGGWIFGRLAGYSCLWYALNPASRGQDVGVGEDEGERAGEVAGRCSSTTSTDRDRASAVGMSMCVEG